MTAASQEAGAAERRSSAWRLLLDWYARHGRASLPWRQTRDPYAILVSEVMLQQTQVERVIPKYHAFLERFPTLAALADTPTADVIRAWAGLGYNARAVRLQQIARQAMTDYGGALPATMEGLLALTGIGRYTAGAVACFAFGQQVATVDTNIRRTLWRLFRGVEPAEWPAPANRDTLALAEWALPDGRAYDWQQALMDLGATVCLARVPRCGACPLAGECPSRGRRFEPLRRQGPFEGSFRQRRAATLRLVADAEKALAELDTDAVASLLKDGLVRVEAGTVSLPA
jgi:A/G-specific adenine glycosylase